MYATNHSSLSNTWAWVTKKLLIFPYHVTIVSGVKYLLRSKLTSSYNNRLVLEHIISWITKKSHMMLFQNIECLFFAFIFNMVDLLQDSFYFVNLETYRAGFPWPPHSQSSSWLSTCWEALSWACHAEVCLVFHHLRAKEFNSSVRSENSLSCVPSEVHPIF